MTLAKAILYKTAKAKISCAYFKAGQIVSVENATCEGEHGTIWFDIHSSEKGPLATVVSYPEHHLTDFCL